MCNPDTCWLTTGYINCLCVSASISTSTVSYTGVLGDNWKGYFGISCKYKSIMLKFIRNPHKFLNKFNKHAPGTIYDIYGNPYSKHSIFCKDCEFYMEYLRGHCSKISIDMCYPILLGDKNV
jgi:hypothetical protein